LVALVSGQAGGEPEDLFVELARAPRCGPGT
jgi:hypothetical protein